MLDKNSGRLDLKAMLSRTPVAVRLMSPLSCLKPSLCFCLHRLIGMLDVRDL